MADRAKTPKRKRTAGFIVHKNKDGTFWVGAVVLVKKVGTVVGPPPPPPPPPTPGNTYVVDDESGMTSVIGGHWGPPRPN